MISLEPSWQELGGIVAEHICQSNIPTEIKAELGRVIFQMANIAHHARVHQLLQRYRDGEVSKGELPSWALESFADCD